MISTTKNHSVSSKKHGKCINLCVIYAYMQSTASSMGISSLSEKCAEL